MHLPRPPMDASGYVCTDDLVRANRKMP